VDLVNPALKAHSGERVYSSVSDPGMPGSEAATASKDWTIHRPVAEKAEVPPLKPLYQMLMDNIKSIWTASSNAVQLDQVHNQLTPPNPAAPAEMPGTFAKEILVYAPNTIKKTENI